MLETKTCSLCKEEKPRTAFYPDKTRPTGLRCRCRECDKADNRYRLKTNPAFRERSVHRAREHARQNPEVYRKSAARYYNTPRGWALRTLTVGRKHAENYGYAPCSATVAEVIASKDDVCAICGVKEEELSRRLCLDHDHQTGKLRGWLCTRCNTGLGGFRDDTAMLKAAVRYLEEAAKDGEQGTR